MKQFYPLSAFLTEYSEKNDGNKYRPVAVGRYGIRPRESIYSKELAKDYSKNKLIHKNTLTVGMGSVQIDIGILTEDITYSASPAYHTYRITGIDATYLRYCLECRNQDMFARFVKRGSRQGKTIDLKRWLTYEIPVYDMVRQAEIVDRLDRILGLIEKRKEQLLQLDQLVKSRFIEMFGDPMTNPYNLPKVILGSVLTIEPQNGLYKPQFDYVSDGTGVPILRIDSFYEGKVSNLSSLKRLICSEIELKRYSLYENDIVINRVNSIEYLGKCGLIQGLVENTVFESNMMRLHVDEHKFHPVYITKLLCSEFIYQQILRRAKKAVNQASINQKDVQSFVVYMPPIEQQDQFAAFVKQTDKSKYYCYKSIHDILTASNAFKRG